jgi:hypothetical protein
MSLEEFLECIDDELHPLALAIIDWANGLNLEFYFCYSCPTKRISFRVAYKDNRCTTHNAFLTIVIAGHDTFRYLLNGAGVDMNDQDNWNEATQLTLNNAQFTAGVIANYNLRHAQL